MCSCLCCIFSACDQKTQKLDGISLVDSSLYKIVPVQHFDQANRDNCVKPLSLDQKSGFIHASFGTQVPGVLRKFFGDAKELILLELNQEVLQENGTVIRVEENKPGGTKYPHLYGAQKIPMTVVKRIIKATRGSDDQWIFITK